MRVEGPVEVFRGGDEHRAEAWTPTVDPADPIDGDPHDEANGGVPDRRTR